jgi:hypothetical protein
VPWCTPPGPLPDGQDDLAFDAAGLAELVRLGRLFQGQDLVDDDPQSAALDEAGDVFEVGAVGGEPNST